MAIIKANAYGHDYRIAPFIEHLVDGFGVVNVAEAVQLKKLGIQKRIIVIGATETDKDWQIAQKHNIEVCVFNDQCVKHLSATQPPLRAHIKLNTGLNRLGVSPKQLQDLFSSLDIPQIVIQGIFSHLADSENPHSIQTKQQLHNFHAALQSCETKTASLEKHLAATAATMLFPESHFDWVRIGIGLYGIWPSPETIDSWKSIHTQSTFYLQPALRYCTTISCIQEVEMGERIGYGGTYRTRRNSRIATIPVGYYEGLPRQLSNKALTKIAGKIAPIVGNICMNMTMVDVTDIPEAFVGTEVTVIDNNYDGPVSAQKQAERADTIPYTLITNIPAHIPRIFLE